uniref:Uncharacterized protein n=1 Tax=Octopus bimaculoides TaxID=37653 RepID=A0A0L8HEG5_OCTBM
MSLERGFCCYNFIYFGYVGADIFTARCTPYHLQLNSEKGTLCYPGRLRPQ